jgi:drug/metabolite transporter (DMT)-like permease
VASGLAAVIVSTEPLWMTLWESWEQRRRPAAAVIIGLLLGLIGIVLLARPGPDRVDPAGFWVLLGATFSWIVGSLISRRAPLHATPARGAGMYMITGGLILLVVSGMLGEFSHVHLAAIRPVAWFNWIYLSLVCSVGGMTAYLWLMQHVRVSQVATYAFVNPVLALLLGAAFGHEALTSRALVAAGLLIVGVTLIVRVTSTDSFASNPIR